LFIYPPSQFELTGGNDGFWVEKSFYRARFGNRWFLEQIDHYTLDISVAEGSGDKMAGFHSAS
jgi:hypothetical protein